MMMKTILQSACLAAAALTMGPSSHASQAADTSATGESAFDRRAMQLVDLIAGRYPYADFFAPSFQAVVPAAQFNAISNSLTTQYGDPVAVENATSANGRSGTVLLRFAKGIATIQLEVGSAADERVTGLRLTGFEMTDDSFDKVAAEIAALPGATGFLVAEIDDARILPVAQAGADRQFAVGSTFKLYVLDELAAQIADGKRRWSDVAPLAHQSFSSAGTANWPVGTPVTLHSLANWMISVSDNSATDTLIHLLGRETIEARMRAAGHSDPSRNIPFLTTVEAFALKGNNFANERTAFVGATDAAQRRILDVNSEKLTLANVDGVSFSGGPRFIDSLEWFASPNDLARLMIDLKKRGSAEAMAAMAINPGVDRTAAQQWNYLGYKGGSELGVISMSLFGERKSDGKWFIVTASWNNPDGAVSTETMVGLVTRLVNLAAE